MGSKRAALQDWRRGRLEGRRGVRFLDRGLKWWLLVTSCAVFAAVGKWTTGEGACVEIRVSAEPVRGAGVAVAQGAGFEAR